MYIWVCSLVHRKGFLIQAAVLVSNIHKRTPNSGILYKNICIGDFFNRHDFMKHWVEVMFYYYYLLAKIEPKRRYEWLRAKRGRRSHPRGAQICSVSTHSRRQRVQLLKMVVETSDKNQLHIFISWIHF